MAEPVSRPLPAGHPDSLTPGSLTMMLAAGLVRERRERPASVDAVDRYRRGADRAAVVHRVAAARTKGFAPLDRRLSRQAGPISLGTIR